MAKITLKASRVNAGLTQKEVAKEIGVAEKTLWSWENGLTFPNPVQIQALCNLYEMTYDDIIFFESK